MAVLNKKEIPVCFPGKMNTERFSLSKRLYQETRGRRPSGEWKQKFRQVVCEKAKRHRMDRVRNARQMNIAVEDVSMSDLSDQNDFRNQLERWWQEFAEEEGIDVLLQEDVEALMDMENIMYQELKGRTVWLLRL
jgi:hypothetical protein